MTSAKDSRARLRRRAQRIIRKGSIVVFAAIMMMVMMAFLAFSVDVGYMYTMQGQLQRSVDAAALAGAGELVNGQEGAQSRAMEYLVRNPVGTQFLVASDEDLEAKLSSFMQNHEDDMEVELGHWDSDTRSMEVSDQLPSTIRVAMTYKNQPLIFGPVLGRDTFTITAESIAMYQPRDIVLVLDLSGSMNDDSEFKSIGRPGLSREVIETGLKNMHAELGSPDYGDLELEPNWVTVRNEPNDSSDPVVDLEYRYDEVYVESDTDLDTVVVYCSNGNYYWFENLSGKTGTFYRPYGPKAIYYAWVMAGNDQWQFFDFDSNDRVDTVKRGLGLDSVPYPYNPGSWSSYINYCISSSGQNANAGYRWKFGHMSLINYWLEQKAANYQTEDLWKVSAQPVTAVKDAVDVFMDYIQEVDTNDRVGLCIYNASDGDWKLEEELTDDFEQVMETTRQRQAGHYHDYTNIGAGMTGARLHLNDEGRTGAFKMIVLMTDGQANWVDGGYDTSGARQYVYDEAYLSADKKYPIVTIALGSYADTGLMEDVSEITGGKYFWVQGGVAVEDYQEDLKQKFREIADDRPLKLVK